MSILFQVFCQFFHRIGEMDEGPVPRLQHPGRLVMVQQGLEGVEEAVDVQHQQLAGIAAQLHEDVRFDQFVQPLRYDAVIGALLCRRMRVSL